MFDNIKAVIFDLDGTLVDSMWIWKDIDIEYLKQHGYDLPDNLQKDIEGMSTTETAQYFKDSFKIPDSIDAIKKEWISMAHDYYEQKIKLKPGAREFLMKLKENGIKIGIGTSNFREMAELVLKSNDVYHYIEALRTSCEVPKGKPSPDVFFKVAEDLGVNPEECMVFEDTHAGVMAGVSAGMKVISVRDELSAIYEDEIKKDSYKMITDYFEILDYL